MSLFDSVLLTLALSHLSLILVYIFIRYRKQYPAQLIALLIVCLMSYLLGSAPGEYFNHPISDYIYRRIGNFSPLLVWLVGHELFEDKKRIHPIVWFLTAAYIIPRYAGAIYVQATTTLDSLILLLTYVAPQIIMIGFVVHALHMAIKGYESDLILTRREDRITFVAGTSILLLLIAVNTTYRIVVLMLGGSFGISTDLTYFVIPTYFYSAYTYFAISIYIVWRFKISYSPVLDSEREHYSPIESDTASSKIRKIDLKLIEQIKHAMEFDKLYLKNKLTVGDLANHISSQEYRVRRAINAHLQYRNFSDFINHYRMLEAERLLLETDNPISNIGFEVGYSSLSGFFKAFKEKYAITPKEYRIRHQPA